MKKAVYGLVAVLFIWVAILSAVRPNPIDACAAQNDLVAFDDRPVVAGSEGPFSYTLTVDSWDLTFDPNVLIPSLEPSGGTINVENVAFMPNSATVGSLGCINDTDVTIEVFGNLSDPDQDGNVNVRIRLTAGFPNQYDEPWSTPITHS